MTDKTNTHDDDEPRLLSNVWSAEQCSKFLNVTQGTWRSYVNRPGKRNPAPQPVHRFGKTPVWDPEEVREYAKSRYRALNS
ncbi:hypothetical protein [Rhodococcus marinonascens]|uniref:hypothetical protein n=1 Tax=Rhodococcus marinonascens TaxID=38311 RepID=UPI000A750F5B|nr:hypothetical protein [Rhodococcus marinonascens]